jgi:uncharacterized protein YegP (UPF0339 family)
MMAIFQVFKSSNKNQYYYLLKATGNSQLILSCEGFASKQSCLDGIKFIIANAADGSTFERKDSYLSYTFFAEDSDGNVIAKSENYTSIGPREQVIGLIRADAPLATIQDLT